MVNVLAITLEDGLPTNEPAGNGDSGIYDWQSTGEDRNGNGHRSRSLLRSLNRERRQCKANK